MKVHRSSTVTTIVVCMLLTFGIFAFPNRIAHASLVTSQDTTHPLWMGDCSRAYTFYTMGTANGSYGGYQAYASVYGKYDLSGYYCGTLQCMGSGSNSPHKGPAHFMFSCSPEQLGGNYYGSSCDIGSGGLYGTSCTVYSPFYTNSAYGRALVYETSPNYVNPDVSTGNVWG